MHTVSSASASIYLYRTNINISTRSIQKLLQVRIQIFKYKSQFLFRVNNIVQPNDTTEEFTYSQYDTFAQEGYCLPSSPYLTILGCASSLRMDISRIAVQGTPSSSLSSRILFNATTEFVSLFCALYTMPYVPSPSFSIF